MGKREIGFVLGILVGLGVWLAPIPTADLSTGGHITLALTLMTVVFWAFQITQPAYTSGLFLVLLAVFGVVEGVPATETTKAVSAAAATAAVAFRSWTGTTMWLVVGAYLIATAVKTSGLGERIAYNYMLRFVSSFKSIIIGIFVLTFVLSLLIPHPWPRALLIMSVMAVIIKSSNIPKEDGLKIGLTVFAASVPVSLIFLTGDATINPLAVASSGQQMGFASWFINMGPPAIVASLLTLGLILVLFKPTKEVDVNKEEIREKLKAMGSFTAIEKRTLIWLSIAIVLWMTDTIHGVNIGWVTLGIAVLMAMPVIGEVLTPKDWAAVPMQTLLFLTAAIAIGVVGGTTGMNAWIASTLLPSSAPSNLFLLAAVITVIAIGLHMLLGSVIAVMGVAVPAIIAFTAPMGINPIVPTMLAYMAIAGHYILPFQHLNMLVGASEETGGYTQKETIRLGVPLIAVMFIVTVGVMIPWWNVTGLL
ncbi:MAG: anion permease [Coriobacteriia bacterium]|nr:anion permease [Coriobacteriia bacterium]MBN2822216.1 anion permease [Coriobacteriia bacterium]